MFISKINSFGTGKNKTFKGYQHEINKAGENVLRFNLPFDSKNKSCQIQIFEVVPDKSSIGGYKVIEDAPIFTKKIEATGTVINPSEDFNFDSEKPFAYRFIVDGHPFTDNGLRYNKYDEDGAKTATSYTIVPRKGTFPTVQGAGVLTMFDIHRPGASYYPFEHEKTGDSRFVGTGGESVPLLLPSVSG